MMIRQAVLIGMFVSLTTCGVSVLMAKSLRDKQTREFLTVHRAQKAREEGSMKVFCESLFKYEAYHDEIHGLDKYCNKYRTLP